MNKIVYVDGLFSDGNAFSIVGKATRAARKAGWTQEQIKDFQSKVTSGSYDNLLATVMEHFADSDDKDAEGYEYEDEE